MSKIMVVDDERTLAETIKYNLVKEGYQVVLAFDGVEAVEKAREERPDLILLDIMLPKFDGFEVCRTLRKDMAVPILMLTAKSDEFDKILGLEIGADDYLTKPFSLRELMTRVKTMLRRVKMMRDEAVAVARPSASTALTIGDLEIDLPQHLILRNGDVLALTPKEYDLLVFLATNRGQVFTREVLIERVWDYSYAGDTRTVDVHIRSLRAKIEEDASAPQHIETVRGVGYRFRR